MVFSGFLKLFPHSLIPNTPDFKNTYRKQINKKGGKKERGEGRMEEPCLSKAKHSLHMSEVGLMTGYEGAVSHYFIRNKKAGKMVQ